MSQPCSTTHLQRCRRLPNELRDKERHYECEANRMSNTSSAAANAAAPAAVGTASSSNPSSAALIHTGDASLKFPNALKSISPTEKLHLQDMETPLARRGCRQSGLPFAAPLNCSVISRVQNTHTATAHLPTLLRVPSTLLILNCEYICSF